MTFSTSPGPDARAVGIPPEQFSTLFPFHLVCDPGLRLVQAGAPLLRICPGLRLGTSIADCLEVIRPEGALSFASMRKHARMLMLLAYRPSGLLLRGQWIVEEDRARAIFLGGPWITNINQFAQLGLHMDDFPVHDPVVDLLQVVQSHAIGLKDARLLTDKLTAQRAKLREANEKLVVQNEALRQQAETNRLLGMLADRTSNGVIMADAGGKVLWVNRAFEKITGYTLDEVKGRTPGSLLQGPETDPHVVGFIRNQLQAGQGFEAELLNYHKSGRKYWIAIETRPIHDADGKLVNFMAIESDITERKRNEQRRDLQYEIVRTLSEAASLQEGLHGALRAVAGALGWKFAAFWRVDASAQVLRVQEMWHDAAIPMHEFLHATSSRSFRSGEGLPGRVWGSGKSAWVRDVSIDTNFPRASSAVKNNLRGAIALPCSVEGVITGVMEFFSDQVEEPDFDLLILMDSIGKQIGQFIARQGVQAMLRSTNALQQAILSKAPYSIISTSPDGIIRMFNATAERMLGYSASEVVGRATPEILHDPGEMASRAEELARQTGRPVQPGFEVFVSNLSAGLEEREWTYIRKDGSRFPVMLSVTKLEDEQGEMQGYLGIASDITERKRAADALLKAKEEAERLARIKSEFLANMSHEIRTPLNAIVGMTGLLRDSSLSQEQQDWAKTLQTSCDVLIQLVNDILDLSKIEAGKLELEARSFDLRQVSADIASILSVSAQSKRLAFSMQVDERVPRWVVGDSLRIKQILLNLLGNAVKFTDTGKVDCTIGLAGDRVLIRVLDTGIGMSNEFLSKLFEPFQQGDTSTTRRFGGSGLGLAISRRLVERMGGTIRAESKPGAGSVFEICLPLARGAAPEKTPGSGETTRVGATPAVKGMAVLLVEDNPVNREVALAILSKFGITADTAVNGLQAVDRVAKTAYDAVLMDVQMPELDGPEATRRIRAHTGRPDRPWIIAMTANALAEDRGKCLSAGMNDYISKPIRQEQLLACLVQAKASLREP